MTLLMDSLFLRFFVFISAETLCHYGKYGSAFFRMQKHKFCRTRMTPPPSPPAEVCVEATQEFRLLHNFTNVAGRAAAPPCWSRGETRPSVTIFG